MGDEGRAVREGGCALGEAMPVLFSHEFAEGTDGLDETHHGEILVWNVVVHPNPRRLILGQLNRRPRKRAVHHNAPPGRAVNVDLLLRSDKDVVGLKASVMRRRRHAAQAQGPKRNEI